eukprot:m.35977 g.35977  ORF g.35977 m.35977 type:complete len:945 (-) comp9947_c1_seq2:151-2985(-)
MQRALHISSALLRRVTAQVGVTARCTTVPLSVARALSSVCRVHLSHQPPVIAPLTRSLHVGSLLAQQGDSNDAGDGGNDGGSKKRHLNKTQRAALYEGNMIGHLANKEPLKALEVFEEALKNPNARATTGLYNHAILACAELGKAANAFKLFNNLKREQNISPDARTYAAMFKVYANSDTTKDRANTLILQFRDEIYEKAGIERNTQLFNALFNALIKRGLPEEVFRSFLHMCEEDDQEANKPDQATTSLLIAACTQTEDLERAVKVFKLALETGVADMGVCTELLKAILALTPQAPCPLPSGRDDGYRIVARRQKLVSLWALKEEVFATALEQGEPTMKLMSLMISLAVKTATDGPLMVKRLDELLKTCPIDIQPAMTLHTIQRLQHSNRISAVSHAQLSKWIASYGGKQLSERATAAISQKCLTKTGFKSLDQYMHSALFGIEKGSFLGLQVDRSTFGPIKVLYPVERKRPGITLMYEPSIDALRKATRVLGQTLPVSFTEELSDSAAQMLVGSLGDEPEDALHIAKQAGALSSRMHTTLSTIPNVSGHGQFLERKDPNTPRRGANSRITQRALPAPLTTKAAVVYVFRDPQTGFMRTIDDPAILSKHIESLVKTCTLANLDNLTSEKRPAPLSAPNLAAATPDQQRFAVDISYATMESYVKQWRLQPLMALISCLMDDVEVMPQRMVDELVFHLSRAHCYKMITHRMLRDSVDMLLKLAVSKQAILSHDAAQWIGAAILRRPSSTTASHIAVLVNNVLWRGVDGKRVNVERVKAVPSSSAHGFEVSIKGTITLMQGSESGSPADQQDNGRTNADTTTNTSRFERKFVVACPPEFHKKPFQQLEKYVAEELEVMQEFEVPHLAQDNESSPGQQRNRYTETAPLQKRYTDVASKVLFQNPVTVRQNEEAAVGHLGGGTEQGVTSLLELCAIAYAAHSMGPKTR